MPVAEIAEFMEEQDGAVYLVGDAGNLSMITGPVSSGVGTISLELEHGVVHLDGEGDQRVAVMDERETIGILKEDQATLTTE